MPKKIEQPMGNNICTVRSDMANGIEYQTKEAVEKALKDLLEQKKHFEGLLIKSKEFIDLSKSEDFTKSYEEYKAENEVLGWQSVEGFAEWPRENLVSVQNVLNLIERQREHLEGMRGIQKYFTLPSTCLTNTTKKILNNPTRVGSSRRGQIKQMENYLTKDSVITYKGNDSTLTFTLERTKELFTKKMQSGAKVFNFLLQKLNEQNRQEVTKFQLIDLVNNGIYANKDSAARGLKTVLDKMYAISIEGITTGYDGRKKEKKTFVKSRIISAFKVSYNECIVSITPIIRESMPYITLLPNWSYTLNENSFMLLDYIFYLARQNAKQIKETGSFNISLDAIRIHLGLPTIEEAGRDSKKLIFEPIEKAITEIEDSRNGTDIKMTPFYNLSYKHISEYLAGRLGIELDETARNYMDQRALAQEEYKKEQKRAEKSKQKAVEAVEKEVKKQL